MKWKVVLVTSRVVSVTYFGTHCEIEKICFLAPMLILLTQTQVEKKDRMQFPVHMLSAKILMQHINALLVTKICSRTRVHRQVKTNIHSALSLIRRTGAKGVMEM